MRLIQRYFFRQTLMPLLLTLAALSVLALLTQSLSTIDLIVENRQSAWTFFKITLLTLPQLFSIIMPLAVFMAVLYALNRLNVDSELVVTKAAGFSPWQISVPALHIAALAMIAHLIINLYIQPLSFRTMRVALLDVKADVASRMVRAGEFISPAEGLTIYTSEVLPSGVMTDVLIYDERSADMPITYAAQKGQISTVSGRTVFTLTGGNMHFIDETGTMIVTDFESNTYDLSQFITADPVLRLKSSDRFLGELFNPTDVEADNERWRHKLRAEGHARLAAPLYNFALVLLALAFLARGEHRKMGYARKIAAAAALGFTARLLGFAVTSAAESDPALNPVQYVIPLLISFAALWFLLHKLRGAAILRRARQEILP